MLFSHGWGGFKEQNTSQAEELASHGFIVIAPDHTYGALTVIFPDGRIAQNNPNALPVGTGLSEYEFIEAAQLLGSQWASDLSFILNHLENLSPDRPMGQFTSHLDFNRIGVFGHSTGGGAAVQFCATDSRCKAALGMDPYIDPVSYTVLENGLSKPYKM